jgi:DNA (cytosine-5)-methyltransferase 1
VGARPQWVACEQVPAVLPLWREMGRGLERLGYSWWAGQLDAADFGVAQNRKRAVLAARQGAAVHPPEPTHYDPRSGALSLFGLEPHVSMADRLGWGMTERPALTVACGTGGGPDPAGVGGSGARRTLERERESVA